MGLQIFSDFLMKATYNCQFRMSSRILASVKSFFFLAVESYSRFVTSIYRITSRVWVGVVLRSFSSFFYVDSMYNFPSLFSKYDSLFENICSLSSLTCFVSRESSSKSVFMIYDTHFSVLIAITKLLIQFIFKHYFIICFVKNLF